MTLRNGRRLLSSVRPLLKAKAFSVTLLATVAVFGMSGAFAPAGAQVKAPQVKQAAKAKARPVAKADPTDRMADQLNAKWQQDNAAFGGFTGAAPASVQAASYSVPPSTAAVGGDLGWLRAEQLPGPLAEASQRMTVGQVAGPIQVPGGISILVKIDLPADPFSIPAGQPQTAMFRSADAFKTSDGPWASQVYAYMAGDSTALDGAGQPVERSSRAETVTVPVPTPEATAPRAPRPIRAPRPAPVPAATPTRSTEATETPRKQTPIRTTAPTRPTTTPAAETAPRRRPGRTGNN